MDSKDFLSLLNKMNNQELADYIQNNGKIKEPTSYDLPFTYVIPDEEDDNLTTD